MDNIFVVYVLCFSRDSVSSDWAREAGDEKPLVETFAFGIDKLLVSA